MTRLIAAFRPALSPTIITIEGVEPRSADHGDHDRADRVGERVVDGLRLAERPALRRAWDRVARAAGRDADEAAPEGTAS